MPGWITEPGRSCKLQPLTESSAIGVSYATMEILYFTLAAILLYIAADWILGRIETAAGRRFQYRSLIFFAILLIMALSSFTLIRQLSGN